VQASADATRRRRVALHRNNSRREAPSGIRCTPVAGSHVRAARRAAPVDPCRGLPAWPMAEGKRKP